MLQLLEFFNVLALVFCTPSTASRWPGECAAAAIRSDLDAVRGGLRGEIRDLARAIRDVQSPLPRILTVALAAQSRHVLLSLGKFSTEARQVLGMLADLLTQARRRRVALRRGAQSSV